MELKRQRDQLEQKLELREGELQTLRDKLSRGTTQPMPGAESPTLAKITMGDYSGGVDDDDDGIDERIRVYLRPLDQKGRVMPVAGRAEMQAVHIPDDGQPRGIARRTYDPKAFDEAWRSGFTGRHYTLELALPDELPEAIEQLTVKVTFTQADTGVERTAQKAFRVRHDRE